MIWNYVDKRLKCKWNFFTGLSVKEIIPAVNILMSYLIGQMGAAQIAVIAAQQTRYKKDRIKKAKAIIDATINTAIGVTEAMGKDFEGGVNG